ncbi:hypothetical protein [Lysinibacillus xylanilyticus]
MSESDYKELIENVERDLLIAKEDERVVGFAVKLLHLSNRLYNVN